MDNSIKRPHYAGLLEFVFLLLAIGVLTTSAVYDNVPHLCRGKPAGRTRFPSKRCDAYIECFAGMAFLRLCAPGTRYNLESKHCDSPLDHACAQQVYGIHDRTAQGNNERYGINKIVTADEPMIRAQAVFRPYSWITDRAPEKFSTQHTLKYSSKFHANSASESQDGVEDKARVVRSTDAKNADVNLSQEMPSDDDVRSKEFQSNPIQMNRAAPSSERSLENTPSSNQNMVRQSQAPPQGSSYVPLQNRQGAMQEQYQQQQQQQQQRHYPPVMYYRDNRRYPQIQPAKYASSPLRGSRHLPGNLSYSLTPTKYSGPPSSYYQPSRYSNKASYHRPNAADSSYSSVRRPSARDMFTRGLISFMPGRPSYRPPRRSTSDGMAPSGFEQDLTDMESSKMAWSGSRSSPGFVSRDEKMMMDMFEKLKDKTKDESSILAKKYFDRIAGAKSGYYSMAAPEEKSLSSEEHESSPSPRAYDDFKSSNTNERSPYFDSFKPKRKSRYDDKYDYYSPKGYGGKVSALSDSYYKPKKSTSQKKSQSHPSHYDSNYDGSYSSFDFTKEKPIKDTYERPDYDFGPDNGYDYDFDYDYDKDAPKKNSNKKERSEYRESRVPPTTTPTPIWIHPFARGGSLVASDSETSYRKSYKREQRRQNSEDGYVKQKPFYGFSAKRGRDYYPRQYSKEDSYSRKKTPTRDSSSYAADRKTKYYSHSPSGYDRTSRGKMHSAYSDDYDKDYDYGKDYDYDDYYYPNTDQGKAYERNRRPQQRDYREEKARYPKDQKENKKSSDDPYLDARNRERSNKPTNPDSYYNANNPGPFDNKAPPFPTDTRGPGGSSNGNGHPSEGGGPDGDGDHASYGRKPPNFDTFPFNFMPKHLTGPLFASSGTVDFAKDAGFGHVADIGLDENGDVQYDFTDNRVPPKAQSNESVSNLTLIQSKGSSVKVEDKIDFSVQTNADAAENMLSTAPDINEKGSTKDQFLGILLGSNDTLVVQSDHNEEKEKDTIEALEQSSSIGKERYPALPRRAKRSISRYHEAPMNTRDYAPYVTLQNYKYNPESIDHVSYSMSTSFDFDLPLHDGGRADQKRRGRLSKQPVYDDMSKRASGKEFDSILEDRTDRLQGAKTFSQYFAKSPFDVNYPPPLEPHELSKYDLDFDGVTPSPKTQKQMFLDTIHLSTETESYSPPEKRSSYDSLLDKSDPAPNYDYGADKWTSDKYSSDRWGSYKDWEGGDYLKNTKWSGGKLAKVDWGTDKKWPDESWGSDVDFPSDGKWSSSSKWSFPDKDNSDLKYAVDDKWDSNDKWWNVDLDSPFNGVGGSRYGTKRTMGTPLYDASSHKGRGSKGLSLSK